MTRAAIWRAIWGLALLVIWLPAAAPGQEDAVAPGLPAEGGLEVGDEPVTAAEPVAETRIPSSELRGLTADERVGVLIAANAAYDDGDYDRAAAGYGELVGSGVKNGHLQYNLGNALLRDGQLGPAVAAYLRAAVLRPRDQDVLANLRFAREKARDALEPPAPSPFFRTVTFWHYSLSRRELVILALALNLLFWSALALRARFPASEGARWLAGLLLLALVLVGGSALLRLTMPEQIAVVLVPESSATAGFEAESAVRFKLHAGTEVRVNERRDEYLRVQLPTGEQGWIPAGDADVVVR